MMLHSDIPAWDDVAGMSKQDGLAMHFELECFALHVCPAVGLNMCERLYGNMTIVTTCSSVQTGVQHIQQKQRRSAEKSFDLLFRNAFTPTSQSMP